MNLLQIRQLFIEASGRNDLVVNLTAYADAGANAFINMGQRYLDEKQEVHGINDYTTEIEAEIGDTEVEVPLCRAVEKVVVITSDGSYELPKKRQDEFIRYTTPTDSSIPLFCCVSYGQGGTTGTKVISLSSPLSEDCTVRVKGKFWSPTLTTDISTSFWSEMYPTALIYAACLKLETFYRNMSGVKKWQELIDAELMNLDHDEVVTQYSEIKSMGGQDAKIYNAYGSSS